MISTKPMVVETRLLHILHMAVLLSGTCAKLWLMESSRMWRRRIPHGQTMVIRVIKDGKKKYVAWRRRDYP